MGGENFNKGYKLKTIGFVTSTKENELRRAILPQDLVNIKNKHFIYLEKGYGKDFYIEDSQYEQLGCKIESREEILTKNIIIDPKIGDADYLKKLNHQCIFGWVHAVQNHDITDRLINAKLTAYAWEDMFEDGRHVFWHNNEMAGEAAIMNAFHFYGKMPYKLKVAVIGKGNVAKGAIKILTLLGATITVFDRKTESLLQKELDSFDVVVNALLWDTARKDHIIYAKDLKRMKRDAMIVDISCDRAGAIETSIPTTIESPVYEKEGVLHYAVDHTPTIFYKTASQGISKALAPFLDDLIMDTPNAVLNNALIIKDGEIIDSRIKLFQNR